MNYRFADSEQSTALHQRIYGPELLEKRQVIPIDPDFEFNFDCTGENPQCCRQRSAADNTVQIELDTRRIVHYCRRDGIEVKGVIHGKKLHLDGLTESQRRKVVAPTTDGSFDYPDGPRTCQFLSEAGRCGVYSVRPLLCRLSPLGFCVDHQEKLIALAYVTKAQFLCPRCFETQKKVRVSDFVDGVFDDRLLAELSLQHVLGGQL